MRSVLLALSVFGLMHVASCTPQAPTEIAWRHGDVEEALQEAAQTGKPVLLYWGAVWCPPCNRLKATLFQDAAFVRQTQDFVPVYLDGDSRGAQLWGEQFAIQGYPTLIILRTDRTEITRLSGGGDPQEIAQALAAARRSQSSVADLIVRAQAQPQRLSAEDWTLVSGYGWEVDTDRIVPEAERAGVLQRLAANAPTPALARRFQLLSLALADQDVALTGSQRTQLQSVLEAVLANAGEVRANRDVLIEDGAELTARLGDNARGQLQASLVGALDQLYAVENLPISDRVSTINAEIEIARAAIGEDEPFPAALVTKVRARAAWVDEAAETPFERQSAIYVAAGLLDDVGDAAGAERLLVAELERSATPFYYMPILADLAEERGDKARALDWLRQGFETSVGPASRVQWGANYAIGVTRFAPEDAAQVERAVDAIIDELATSPDSYHQRTRMRFARLETALRTWAARNDGAAVLVRLRTRMAEVCPLAQTDAEARQACAAWLSATA
ncbi:thioredoxin family protein [Candidatus Viadribacter manganicus]|uniref:Thioredoxin domain-containing protein n=1 Tax=Candidatus Viadribacter manganicus TaxID=1759059 RepID=A0A1B1AEH9_9PROT|nr:thioredoxin family protein [Candidatus Viadribacter manganicus]ANP44957.1 hypothetical protein ATE48_02965 [Candidatus Viadribacter manganicus]